MPYDENEVRERLSLFATKHHGIETWVEAPETITKMSCLDTTPLTHAIFNQLLTLHGTRGMSADFYKYYWCSSPELHPYDLTTLDYYSADYSNRSTISSLDQLLWGLLRFYLDALLYTGNIREAYRELSRLTHDELILYFGQYRYPIDDMEARGAYIQLHDISPDDRHFISEISCKTLDVDNYSESDIGQELHEVFISFISQKKKPTVKNIYDAIVENASGEEAKRNKSDQMSLFVCDEFQDEIIDSEIKLQEFWNKLRNKLRQVRSIAISNTKLYLSMANEIDVYVATSMRNRDDFRKMARFCKDVFEHPDLKTFHTRYFDPTLSAADGHEDKGLIECLMVKCAKVLVYNAGDKESYGKDAEAAMALSLGKAVIFYCDKVIREKFYREIHPLSRLIDFKTGVVVGAIVSSEVNHTRILLNRIFNNKMQYKLTQHKHRSGYLHLVETLTDSVIRLQTNDDLLSQAFWNYYHGGIRRA